MRSYMYIVLTQRGDVTYLDLNYYFFFSSIVTCQPIFSTPTTYLRINFL